MLKRCILAASLLGCAASEAKVVMPKIFGNNMVLQQDISIPVWGKADPGEKVTVALDGDSASAVAGQDGKWLVSLAAKKADGKPLVLSVKGQKNEFKFSNVVLGDVWVASGQSNIQFALRDSEGGTEAAAAANLPQIRFFQLRSDTNPPAAEPSEECNGSWEISTPKTAGRFSAVAFYFARDVSRASGKPVGIIAAYLGGSNIKSWISEPVLEKSFPQYAEEKKKLIAGLPELEKQYRDSVETFKKREKEWKAKYEKAYKEYKVKALEARREGKKIPPAPPEIMPPKPLKKPVVAHACPTSLFNAMINPVIPYAMRGALWYQGESNAKNSDEYAALLESMIRDWRTRWGQGDFLFYIVQLPNFGNNQSSPAKLSGWPVIREAQSRMRETLPNVGMAVTIDLGDGGNLHPRKKLEIGERLAMLEKQRMGQVKTARGPTFEKMEVKGESIIITFANAGELKTKSGSKKVPGFAVAGENGAFQWADAEIIGANQVAIDAKIKKPAAVRYACTVNPPTDLYNEEGLPAEPFRTDNW